MIDKPHVPIPPELMKRLGDPEAFARAHVGMEITLYLPMLVLGVDPLKVRDAMVSTVTEAIRQRDKYIQDQATKIDKQLDEVLGRKNDG